MSDPWKEIADLPAEKRELLEKLLAAEGLEVPDAEAAEARPPRNAKEQTLLRLWSETLERDDIGIDSNFFRLGGNSIHCIRIVSQARHQGLLFTTQQMFEKPTIAELAEVVETGTSVAGTVEDAPPFAEADLSEGELKDLLATLAGGEEATEIVDVYTLSPVQEGMLFHILANPAPGLYCDQGVCTLGGELDAEAFRQAWERLLDRHEALRTSFHWKALRHPVQAVHARVPLPLEVEDWQEIDPSEVESRLEQLVAAERNHPMPIEQPPLLRLRLLRLGQTRHILLWTHHHLAHDAWSLTLLVRELLALYEEAQGGDASRLEQAPGYRQYIAWLKQLDSEGARVWWQGHLDGLENPTPLPEDRGQPTKVVLEHREYQQHERFLKAHVYESLDAAARRHALTLATFVQGAWALLLAEAVDQARVTFGTVVAGRPQELARADGMVGLFINTLPLQVELLGELSLVEWLQRVQDDVVALRRHEQTRLVELAEWSQVPDDLPLFESVVVVQNVFLGISRQQASALKIDDLQLLGHSNYPLMLRVTPGERLQLECLYDPARLRPAVSERLLERVALLLEELANSVDQATLEGTRDWLEEQTAKERARIRDSRRRTQRGSLRRLPSRKGSS